MKRFFLLYVAVCFSTVLYSQITQFKLENGLTVIINEDHNTPSVFGSFVVKTGSVDEFTDATGMAHFLEHMMFKGSINVGTTNWEKEQIHYEKIIKLYDQLVSATEEERANIQKQINEESLLAGQYTINNEFSNLIQSIGGTSLNAATGHDVTSYFNTFPSFQLKKWLMLYADRFENPVFRGFQAELETVYEEKNMYSDDPYSVLFEEYFSEMFGNNNPYARPILGSTEHLKTPSLSKLIEFYNKYYVPSNMALVLSGDVNIDEAKVLVNETVGQWNNKTVVVRNDVGSLPTLSEKKKIKRKLTPVPILIMGYNGVPSNSDDAYKMDVLVGVLNNNNRTGLLDKLVLDGDVQTVSASLNSFRQTGTINFVGIPVFDVAQRRFSSLSDIESNVNKVLKKLMDGNIEEWLLESVKDEIVMRFELRKESNQGYGMMLVNAFGNDKSIQDLEDYIAKIKSVTKSDLVQLSKKYFNTPYLSIHSTTGEPTKDKIAKPNYKPIVPASGVMSEFAQNLINEKATIPSFIPIDFNKDFVKTTLAKGVTLYHTKNHSNDIFSLTVKFGAGSAEIPELDYSTSLMNRAGIMSLYTPEELKKAFGQLGCIVEFSNDRNYTYITIRGKESSLARVCNLVSKTYLMPSIDEKQMNSLLGRELGQRSVEHKEKSTQSDALSEYIKYGKNSSYIDRLTAEEIVALTVSKLAAAFIKATKYESSVHYTGKLSLDEVKNILTKNLVFQSDLKKSNSPVLRQTSDPKENTIYLVHNKNARQSDVFLFANISDYSKSEKPKIDAFNEYFGGGFNGLVLQQLRELKSLAYHASGGVSIPLAEGHKLTFNGYIGTQADKTLDAVDGFMALINEMPINSSKIDNIKGYLNQSLISITPPVRDRTMVVENWIRNGYTEDPRVKLLEEYNGITFDDVVRFYESNLKNKPVSIGIIVNTKEVDKKRLETFGKVITVNPNILFKN